MNIFNLFLAVRNASQFTMTLGDELIANCKVQVFLAIRDPRNLRSSQFAILQIRDPTFLYHSSQLAMIVSQIRDFWIFLSNKIAMECFLLSF